MTAGNKNMIAAASGGSAAECRRWRASPCSAARQKANSSPGLEQESWMPYVMVVMAGLIVVLIMLFMVL